MLSGFLYRNLSELRRAIIKNVSRKRGTESIYFKDAFHRVLAEDIYSRTDIPSLSVSHFDGYAVNSSGTSEATTWKPVKFKVKGAIYPESEMENLKIHGGEAYYVTTGSLLPEGADCVIPVERVKHLNRSEIEVFHSFKPGEYITLRGEDFRRGQKIFSKGHKLRPIDVYALGLTKNFRLKVYRKLRASILSIGNELTDEPKDSEGRLSYNLFFYRLLMEIGTEASILGVVDDDPEEIRKRIREGLRKTDVVLTIGGCSVGERDYVLRAAKSLLGFKLVARGIKVQPGRVTSVSLVEGKPLIMLPGHIQSALSGFLLVAVPLIRFMEGYPYCLPFKRVKAKFAWGIKLKKFKPFIKVRFVETFKVNGETVAKPLLGDSSLISVLTGANGFVLIPKNKDIVKKGEKVVVHMMNSCC